MSEQEIYDDLDAWWAILTDYGDGNSAKAKFQDTMGDFEKGLNELAQMNSDGDFDQLPASVKAKFVWAWQQFDAARDAVRADEDFMASLSWRP